MSMISEQVKGLRKLANQWKHNDVAGFNLIFGACDTIEALSAKVRDADRPTGWIPTSERLPDIGDTYLVTVMVGKEIRTDVADSFGSYIDGFWDTFNDWIEDEECHVIAWMPLPEPYKGGGTGE